VAEGAAFSSQMPGKPFGVLLVVFAVPRDEEWICLRTTNVIERVSEQFKRRTKPMEIIAGKRSCYSLLSFSCLKMQLRWRSKPIGNVAENLPFFKRLADNNFTQNN